MKKAIIAYIFCLGTFAVFAQDEEYSAFDEVNTTSQSSESSFVSKNGHEVLPKAGDWAIGVDALPFFRYLGNSFNGETYNNSLGFGQANKNLPTLTIYGKYLKSDDFAYRASIDIFAAKSSTSYEVDDDNSSNPDDYLYDIVDRSNFGLTISGGFEKRRGHGRVQGIYGAEAYFHFNSDQSIAYNYANELTVSNQTPSTSPDYFFNNPTNVPTPANGSRIIKANEDDYISAGVRGFVGVEYFFAPQMSIGGEFYLGAGYTNTGGESVTAEGFDPNTNEVVEFTNVSQGSYGINVGTSNVGGSINLMFYF